MLIDLLVAMSVAYSNAKENLALTFPSLLFLSYDERHADLALLAIPAILFVGFVAVVAPSVNAEAPDIFGIQTVEQTELAETALADQSTKIATDMP